MTNARCTRDRIRALRIDAANHGDVEQVELCTSALEDGDMDAIAECVRALDEADAAASGTTTVEEVER